jgi:hypothetical protein
MCKVRPFERDIWLEDRTIRVRGIVTNKGYILAADSVGLEIKLSATHTGMDEKGKFAVLEEGEQLKSDGSIVKVEQYSEEPFPGTDFAPSGLEISVTMVASDKTKQTYEDIFRSDNIDPGKVNLIVPNEWSFSIYYNSVGNVDGLAFHGMEPEK